MNQRKLESITLEKFIQLNDRVIVNVDPERRSWAPVPYADGTIGTVVGFKQWDNYVSRVPNFGTPPGIYSERSIPLVRFDGGINGAYIQASDLAFEDPTLKDKRVEERAARGGFATDDEYSNKTRIGDLPETPFWESDIVTVHSKKWGGDFGQPHSECATPAVLKIDSINYDDREGQHTYSVSGLYASGHTTGQIRAAKEELLLVERGNIWRYFNNEAPVFVDLKDEIVFHQQLGKVQSLRNELRNNYYLWTLAEALAAIRDGRADVFSHSAGFFGGHSRIEVKRFDDRDMGERVRAEAIKGWETTPENVVDPEMDAWVESQTKEI